MRRTGRKTREAPPPGRYVRSRVNDRPAEVVRTSRLSPDGRWLYRLWYGEVLGSAEWTLQDLLALNLRWMDRRPRGLRPRREALDSGAQAQVAG